MGAGSGILSFFAVQAGAKKVYAIEASNMAVHCQNLIQSNRLDDKITLIAGKVEEVRICILNKKSFYICCLPLFSSSLRLMFQRKLT